MEEQKKASEFMQAIDKIVSKFSNETPEVAVKAAFVSATLETGEAVEIEPSLEVGAAVVVIKEGEVMPAPDAAHVLVSGEVITTVDGIITELVPVEEEVVEPVEEGQEMEGADNETVEQKVKKVVESTIKESHFTSHSDLEAFSVTITEAFNTILDERLAKQEEQLHAILMLGFEAFEAKPISEPTKKAKFSVREKKKNIFTGK